MLKVKFIYQFYLKYTFEKYPILICVLICK